MTKEPPPQPLCQSCGGRGRKLRSSRCLQVIRTIEGRRPIMRIEPCLDCRGTGQAEAA